MVNVSPATLTFDATNPDLAPAVAAHANATVSWQNRSSIPGRWDLMVRADSASFTNCPRIPVSAVTVSCVSAVTNTASSGNCRPGFALSTSPERIAGGNQTGATFSYSVALSFTLADNWRNIAESSSPCSLSLSYTATVP